MPQIGHVLMVWERIGIGDGRKMTTQFLICCRASARFFAGFALVLCASICMQTTALPDSNRRSSPVLNPAHFIHPDVEHRGIAFLPQTDFSAYSRAEGVTENETVLTSPELTTNLPANEIIVSWNATTPPGTGIVVEARAFLADGHSTKYYTLGRWSLDGKALPRTSVANQRDADGDVHTDTLALYHPAVRVQLRVTLHGSSREKSGDEDQTAAQERADKPQMQIPEVHFLGVLLTDTHAAPTSLLPNKKAWGESAEIAVPGRPQTGYPGANGWCSPTSTAMVLAYWSKSLHRPELNVPVSDAAHAIYDTLYDGTGNWPFNTAFAGSFPGIRAFVTRFSDVRELEDWIAAGLPVVVSVSYDLLKGRAKDEDPGHLMVCVGFTDTGDIVLNDPAHHPEKGEVCRRVFSRANFLKGWSRSHNLVYLIYPTGTKTPTDTYGHWSR